MKTRQRYGKVDETRFKFSIYEIDYAFEKLKVRASQNKEKKR